MRDEMTGVVMDPDEAATRPAVFMRRTADVICFLCGSTAGTLRQDEGKPIVFIPAGQVTVNVMVLYRGQSLRCDRCGGATHVEEIEISRVRVEPLTWDDEEHRRGRPPKWLVEKRHRERAESDDFLKTGTDA